MNRKAFFSLQPSTFILLIMWERFRDFWLPRLLFVTTLGFAIALALAVFLAPLVTDASSHSLLALFAQDVVVRRTALASAAGLAVTAFVFFRPGGFVLFRSRDKNRVPPPMAGA